MMRASVSRQLLAITVGVISLAVALAGGVLLRQHLRELYRGFESGAVVLTRAVAEHCEAPLVFDDRQGAAEILAKLERSTFVARAVLYDRHGQVEASYEAVGARPPPPPPLRPAPALEHQEGYLHVFEPVLHRGSLQGTLYLAASSASLRGRSVEGIQLIVLSGVAAIIMAAALGWLLQRTITRPILRLAETMGAITGETMLSTRVEHHSGDEIGVHYAGFNRMLDQLAARQRERDRADARLRALIAALPDPGFVLDEEGKIVDVLAGRPQALGPRPQALGPDVLCGRPIAEVTAPTRPIPFAEVIARAQSSGRRSAWPTSGICRRASAGSTPW